MDFEKIRKNMVETQIKGRGIKDPRILSAMIKVPRHKFIPETEFKAGSIEERAYSDGPVPIGYGQTISQPYIVAYMTEEAKLKDDDRVLEIGTGSGYQAAVLAQIIKEVHTVEIIEALQKFTEKVFKELDYKNIISICADGTHGWRDHAPYDAIIGTAAPRKEIPPKLFEQLKPGGRIIMPVGDMFQNIIRVTKTDTGNVKETLIPVRFVPMTGDISVKTL